MSSPNRSYPDEDASTGRGTAMGLQWTPAVLHRQRHGRVQCVLCPFRCSLKDGETGLCGVRRRAGDRMETATFASSVRHWDTVERKPLYHFRPGTPCLTLAAPGCTFACDYCINHRMSQYGREDSVGWDAEPVDADEVVREAAARSGCVAISYTEPSLALELTVALAESGRAHGVDVVWKSNGFLTPEAVELAAPHVAAVNVDLKTLDEHDHRELTGARPGPVLDALTGLRERGVWVEVSTPLIPGLTAGEKTLRPIARALAALDPAIPWHLVRATPAHRRTGHAPTSVAALEAGVRTGHEEGLRHVYVERALGAAGRNTACPTCRTTVVERDVWALGNTLLDHGRCPHCGTELEGRW
ncbi:AmmeMemoRadiSam system radical SAM enzyme [Streptomyces sp. WM6386]|uniref:AmmeMemoRadiSam system radical SAM enzyme n=1 Tax=Streptomyces sp. WM6386 TaxID=1415558 RepID=UPI0019015F02|nr:AmmeMemoRadiSam system radical SAM enzyme [Streptomyces sp. WM6386]